MAASPQQLTDEVKNLHSLLQAAYDRINQQDANYNAALSALSVSVQTLQQQAGVQQQRRYRRVPLPREGWR